jgi:clan AA aspartic protease
VNDKTMGEVFVDITILNGAEYLLAKQGIIPMDNVRKMKVNALVDTGATTLIITTEIKTQLNLMVLEKKELVLADGTAESYEFVGPVEVRFENRRSLCQAVVIPGATDVLLGAIPMEDMDVVIDMKTQKLIVPPDRPYLARAYAR